MNVDTGQFLALRGELSGLNAAVAELASRQLAQAEEFRGDRSVLINAVHRLACVVREDFETQLRGINGGGRHAAPRRGHLRLVEGGQR